MARLLGNFGNHGGYHLADRFSHLGALPYQSTISVQRMDGEMRTTEECYKICSKGYRDEKPEYVWECHYPKNWHVQFGDERYRVVRYDTGSDGAKRFELDNGMILTIDPPNDEKPLTCTCGRWKKKMTGLWTNAHYGYVTNAAYVCINCHDILHDTWVEHPKEKTMPYNDDNRSYADCFRVLREAKKEGVIANWDYESAVPGINLYHRNASNPTRLYDNGTKGDIGILREAADYVVGLRKKNEVPDLKTMAIVKRRERAPERMFVMSQAAVCAQNEATDRQLPAMPWDGHFPTVIEEPGEGAVEWGISFTGSNPEEKDYVPMPDGPTAFKLIGLLQLYGPQSRETNQGESVVDQVMNSAGSK